MATPQINALFNALKNVRLIKAKLAATNGALTSAVFSTTDVIQDMNLDNARGSISLEFQSLVQNIRAIKPTDPIAIAYPNIHYKLNDHVARRNWLAHEYGTMAPIKWSEVADSIYNDVPIIESDIIAALKAQGYAEP